MTINLEVHWGYRVLTHINQMAGRHFSAETPKAVTCNPSHKWINKPSDVVHNYFSPP
jgi:hypothetical protein